MNTQRIDRLIIFGVVIAMIVLFGMMMSQRTFGSAPTGLPATFATSSILTVGPQKPSLASTTVPIFDANTTCAARQITTYAVPITLWFSNVVISSTTANPAAAIGVFQGASTTVVYDSGQYGCPFVSAFGYSSTTIMVQETR